MRRFLPVALVALFCVTAEAAPLESDAYTRYELLAPDSGKFRILYDVTAAQPGATAYFNPIRKGSIASDEAVYDRASGKPLEFHQVSGAQAQQEGLSDADPGVDYIKVTLARPVPAIDGGGGRIRIEKTYEDKKSYLQEGGDILFSRPLGIKRNAVVLPAGYALISCNYPSQIEQEGDGRIKISFFNVTPAEAPLILRAHPIGALAGAGQKSAIRQVERAAQTRDIVYFLKDPDSHSFDLYHDYTETKPGMDHYLNVVRTGSKAANPSAVNLDSGAALTATHLKGAEITAAGIKDEDLGPVAADTEVVLFRFAPLAAGQSIRLRMSETYQDAKSYHRDGEELVFERSLGRAINAVVLPAGWVLTNSVVPAIVSATADGRVRLDFLNPRNDEVKVQITARRLSTK